MIAKYGKRALSFFLAVIMIVSAMPMQVFADDGHDHGEESSVPVSTTSSAQAGESEELIALRAEIAAYIQELGITPDMPDQYLLYAYGNHSSYEAAQASLTKQDEFLRKGALLSEAEQKILLAEDNTKLCQRYREVAESAYGTMAIANFTVNGIKFENSGGSFSNSNGTMTAQVNGSDKGTCSDASAASMTLYITNDTAFAYRNGAYERLVFLTADGLVSYEDYRSDKYTDVLFSQESSWEKVQSVTETQNQITVTCTMKRNHLKKALGEQGAKSFDSEYLLDERTYALISAKGTLLYGENETLEVSMDCTYNAEAPEEIKAFQEYANQTEDLRTITLVFHSGTQQEKAEIIQAPKGLSVGLGLPVNATEVFSIYADAACTIPYQSNGDYTSDATIYIK